MNGNKEYADASEEFSLVPFGTYYPAMEKNNLPFLTCAAWMTQWMTEWMTQCFLAVESQEAWMTEWMTQCLLAVERQESWMTEWMTQCLLAVERQEARMTEWMTQCLLDVERREPSRNITASNAPRTSVSDRFCSNASSSSLTTVPLPYLTGFQALRGHQNALETELSKTRFLNSTNR